MIDRVFGKIIKIESNLLYIYVNNIVICAQTPDEKIFNLEQLSNYYLYIDWKFTLNKVDCYAFNSFEIKEFFKLLLKVPGIGGKVALQILKYNHYDELIYFIAQGQFETLCKCPKITPKIAKALLDKIQKDCRKIGTSHLQHIIKESKVGEHSLERTLLKLGYRRDQIAKLDYTKLEDKALDVQVREAIKQIND